MDLSHPVVLVDLSHPVDRALPCRRDILVDLVRPLDLVDQARPARRDILVDLARLLDLVDQAYSSKKIPVRPCLPQIRNESKTERGFADSSC